MKLIHTMKKLLLILSIFAVTFSSAFAADLNPFAYNLTALYDKSTNSVIIGYHLNAPANKVKIVIYQDEANPAKSMEFTTSSYLSAGAHTAIVPLAGVAGGRYSFKIEVYGKGQAGNVAFHKRLLLNSPFSIDIDNNTNSPYFGRTLVTQPTTKNNTLRGIYEFTPADFTTNTSQVYGGDGISHNGGVDNYYQGTQGWYEYSHATPLRVRIAQDGTGRIFTTACDVDMNTYLWYVNPANLDQWTSLITAQQMNDIVDHPNNSNIHNISLDVRVDEQGKINLLLLSGTIEYGNGGVFKTGYIYSGKYVLPANFPSTTTGTYTPIVNPNVTSGTISPHNYVKSGLLPVAINSSSQFDKYGGYWYCGYSRATEKDPFDNVAYNDKSALMHISTNGNLKHDYTSGEDYLKRNFTGSGGFRYNRDFTQVLVANGYRKTARLYNVSQTSATAHPTLSFVTELGTIFSDASNYITDFAWDHANNIYVVLRNGSSGYGIYTFATKYDAATPFVTRVPDGTTFEVNCYDNVLYDLTTSVNDPNMGTISAGGEYKSCSEVEITATPKEGYRLLNWTINGTNFDSDGDNTYTVYMTDDMTVQANFGSAVFNVTWWNLFQDGEDIAQESSTTPGSNERLWRLYQVFFNQYCVNNSVTTRKDKAWVGDDNTERLQYKEFDVAGYFTNRNDANTNYLKATAALRSNETTDENTPFVWLRKYIEYINNGVEIKTANTYASLGNRLGYALYCFFNTTNTARNYQANSATYIIGLESGHKSFETYGKSENWRPWWTEEACDLPRNYNYSTPMPTSWKQINITCQDYSITTDAACPSSYKIEDVPITSWYKWNTAPKSNQLLAWREGGTDPKNNRIVHHVDKSMALYATYVDKNLQEDDPDPTGEYDAKNSDVLSLLANENHGTTDHNITVDRKFVAGMYNTVCFPFDLHRSLFPTKLKDAEVLTFDGVTVTGNEYGEPVAVLNFITLEEYWQKWNEEYPDKQVDLGDPYMEAGVPYLIKPKTDISDDYLTYSGLKYWKFFNGEREPYSIPHNGVTFQGVLNPTILPEDACILVADNRLAKVTGTGEDRKIKGYRGYFVIDNIAISQMAEEGNVYFSFNKPVTTSVPLAPEAEQPKKIKVRKVMYDGQIYILRGDEVYSITGNRVK